MVAKNENLASKLEKARIEIRRCTFARGRFGPAASPRTGPDVPDSPRGAP